MKRKFQEELEVLKQEILRMAAKTETMIYQSIQALVKRDPALMQDVPTLENDVNTLQLEIDEHAFRMLALYQPMAGDLRFIIGGMKIGSDLERVADQAVNITENTEVLLRFPELKPLIDIPRMAELARGMLKDSIDAFIEGDAGRARQIVVQDDQVDALKDQVFREVLTYMIADPKTIQVGMPLILVARNLERIADHATNIAEDVVYMVEAKDIRHHAEERSEQSPN
jgi:phosphate transport system protein